MRKLSRAMMLLTLPAMLCVLSGCGLTGTWVVDKFSPEAERGDFDFAHIKFSTDGTYTAVAKYGGKSREIRGTYELDKENDTLTFRTEDGLERKYRVDRCATCGYMDVSNYDPPPRWTARLRRK